MDAIFGVKKLGGPQKGGQKRRSVLLAPKLDLKSDDVIPVIAAAGGRVRTRCPILPCTGRWCGRAGLKTTLGAVWERRSPFAAMCDRWEDVEEMHCVLLCMLTCLWVVNSAMGWGSAGSAPKGLLQVRCWSGVVLAGAICAPFVILGAVVSVLGIAYVGFCLV